MPIYIFYDKKTGEVVHTHREVILGSERTIELEPEKVLSELGPSLRPGLSVLELADLPPRERGFRWLVDPSTRQLVTIKQTRKEVP